jgi:putative ABC transport system ATP-binding protein
VSQSSSPSFMRLWQLAQLERRDLRGLLLYAVGVGFLTLTLPVSVQALINTIAMGGLVQPLVVLAFLLALGLGLSALFTLAQWWLLEMISRRIVVRSAERFVDRLVRVDAKALTGRDPVELVNRFFDVVNVEKSASVMLLDGLAATLQISVGLALLAVYHPVLLAFDAGLLLLAALGFLLGRGALRSALDESSAKYSIAAWLQEVARHRTLFSSQRRGQEARQHAASLALGWLERRDRHWQILVRQKVAFLGLQVLATVAVLALGGWLVVAGQLSLGQLVAAELVMTATVSSLAKIGTLLPKVYDLNVGLEKLAQVEELPLEDAAGRALEGAAPVQLELRELELLGERCEAQLAPGRAAFLRRGPRARQLFDLLERRDAPSRGTVLLNEADIRELAPAALRDLVYRVDGEAVVKASVAENLRLGRPDADVAEMWAALEQVGLKERILDLPNGLHTLVGPFGPLEQPARVQLTLARALLARPRLLLIDGVLDELVGEAAQAARSLLLAEVTPFSRLIATSDPSQGWGRALLERDEQGEAP